MNTVPKQPVDLHCLWTAKDVATYLRASRSWVYKAAEAGDLPCIRVGAMLRFSPAAVKAFIEGASGARILPLKREG